MLKKAGGRYYGKTYTVTRKTYKATVVVTKAAYKKHAYGHPIADPSKGQDRISTKALSWLLGARVSSLNESLAGMAMRHMYGGFD